MNSARVLVPGGAAARNRAPTVDSAERSTSPPPTVIDHARLTGSTAPTCCARSGTIGRNAGITTPDVLLYTDIRPVPNAIVGTTVSEVEMPASPLVNRSMPWVSCMSEISTVTPVTIRMTPHGMRRMACCSSTLPRRVSSAAMNTAVRPTCASKPTTATIRAEMPAMVSQCLRSKCSTSASADAASPSRLRKSFRPPNSTKPPVPTITCASTLYP